MSVFESLVLFNLRCLAQPSFANGKQREKPRETKGYPKCSITILGPNDTLKSHNPKELEAEIAMEEHGGDLARKLMPPTIELHSRQPQFKKLICPQRMST